MISMENVNTANFYAEGSNLRSPNCKALYSNADMIERCCIVGGDGSSCGFFLFVYLHIPLCLPLFNISQPVLFVTSECDHVVINHNIVVNSLAG
jgi:hypothetical protein